MAFQGVNQVFADIWDSITHAIRVTVTNPTAAGGDASAANQVTGNTALGATNDAAVTDATATASIIAALKGLLALNKVSTAGGNGSKTIAAAGTPEKLVAASTPCTTLIITARVGNTKQVAYGWTNAIRATAAGEIGAQLQPGDSVSLRVNNVNSIYLDAQVTGEGVGFTYMTD